MKNLYPNLDEFFGTYFHQDWHEDARTALEIVDRYLKEWPPEEIREAARELRHMLSEGPTEAELADKTRQMGSFYNPQADGLSYGDWLRQIHELLSSKDSD